LTMDVISHEPGATVTLDVVRSGKPIQVKVTLGQRPTGTDWGTNKSGSDDNGQSDNDNGSPDNATIRGISVETLTPDLAQQVGVPPATKGVVVGSVDADSPAADAVARGTVIVQVDHHPVANDQEFRRLMNQAQGKPVLLTVNNGGSNLFVVVQPK